jgi:hypothetical protein
MGNFPNAGGDHGLIMQAIQLTVLHSHGTICRSKRLPSGGDLHRVIEP